MESEFTHQRQWSTPPAPLRVVPTRRNLSAHTAKLAKRLSLRRAETGNRTNANISPLAETCDGHTTFSPAALALQRGVGNQQLQELRRREVEAARGDDQVLVGTPRSHLELDAQRASQETGKANAPSSKPGLVPAARVDVAPWQREALRSLETSGSPLPPPALAEFEPRMGPLTSVRIHRDSRSGALAQAFGARAFTYGRHVVLAPAAYQATSTSGAQLLAHELMHVAQQGAGAGGPTMTPVVQRQEGEPGWWERNISQPYQSLKEEAYGALIDAVRAAQRETFSTLRDLAGELPPELQGIAETIITADEEVVNLLTSAAFGILGIVVGAGEGIVDVAKGLVQLVLGVLDLTASFIAGFFSAAGREAFNEKAAAVVAALKGLPAGLRKLVDDWLVRFTAAPPERQSAMIGELTGQVLVFIATFHVAAAKAAQIPRLSVPVVVARGDQLALAVVGVDIASPAAAGLLGGTGMMLAVGAAAGRRKPDLLPNGRLRPGKGGKFHDPASQVELRHKKLPQGERALRKAGLKPDPPDVDGAVVFRDGKGVARAKYVPRKGKEPQHWSKFEPSGNQKHYLSDAGRPVSSTDKAHRIPAGGGGPKGGTGPGAPQPPTNR